MGGTTPLLRSLTGRSERFAGELPERLEERCEVVVFVPLGACESQQLVRCRRGRQWDAQLPCGVEREDDVLLHQPDVEPCLVGEVEDEWRRVLSASVSRSGSRHHVGSGLGSMPARSARSRPSANASICTARLMLIASFSTSPCPFSPMCVGVPSSRRTGSTRAYACSSPRP